MTGRAISNTAWLVMLGASSALVTATQLRMQALAIGVGELFLFLLVVQFAISRIVKRQLLDGKSSQQLMQLATILAIAYLLGTIIAEERARTADLPVRESLAIAFSILVALVADCVARSASINARHLAVLTMLIAGPIVLLYVVSRVTPSIFGIELLYDTARFQAWSINPNQVALVIVPIPFLCALAANGLTTWRYRSIMLGLAACTVTVGVATKSDAILAAWCVGFGIWAAVHVFHRIGPAGKSRGASVSAVVLACAVIGLSMGPLLETAHALAAKTFDAEGSQGAVRLSLWENGLRAAEESILFGYGPGPHSGILGPHQGMEAHNTWLDLLAGAGLLGFAAYFAFQVWVLRQVLRSSSPVLVAALGALLVFSTFHFVLRQPAFWFYIVLLIALSSTPTALESGRQR